MFVSKPKFDPLVDISDLSGKVVIVTGSNAGIGYATVKHLARKGAKVYMAARNKNRAEEAIAKLKEEGLGPGNGEVIWLELDLADPRNAKRAAQEFMSKEKYLDILVHNAALLFDKRQLTADGVDLVYTVNVISPFVLTRELMPVLNQAATKPNPDVRIVVVASEAYRVVIKNPRFRNLDDFNNEYKCTVSARWNRYAYSKLSNILYASELQRKLSTQGSPITVLSLHPGTVNTFSARPSLRKIAWLINCIGYLAAISPDVGAYTSAFAAASPDIAQDQEKYKGVYLLPYGKIGKLVPDNTGEELAKELWTTIEGYLAEKDI